MSSLEDRQMIARSVEEAHRDGARLEYACAEAGITVRTLQRWKRCEGLERGDRRPQAVRPVPAHALSEAEREEILRIANEPRFADLPPARIVPMLADEGVYVASESSFSRVLRAHGQTRHRGRAKAPQRIRPPSTHVATAPRQIFCWDMTYLPATVMGHWFYLYLILDLYSRKIVGFEVHETDDSPVCQCDLVLAGMMNRVILGVRCGFLKRRQKPAVTYVGVGQPRQPARTAMESRSCLARRRDRSAEQASAVPKNHKNASITRKTRISIPINTWNTCLLEFTVQGSITHGSSTGIFDEPRSVDSEPGHPVRSP